jgi:hypothetical protein
VSGGDFVVTATGVDISKATASGRRNSSNDRTAQESGTVISPLVPGRHGIHRTAIHRAALARAEASAMKRSLVERCVSRPHTSEVHK